MGASSYPTTGAVCTVLLTVVTALLAAACIPVRSSATEASLPPRAAVIDAALSQASLLDCATYDPPDATSILPPYRQFVTVLQDVESATEGWADDTAARAYTNPQLPELTDGDRVIPSPTGQQALVAFGAALTPDGPPPVAVLYNADRASTPLMQNCQHSTEHVVWSPDGRYLAYPIYAVGSKILIYDEQSGTSAPGRAGDGLGIAEIRIFDVQSGATSVLIRHNQPIKLHGLAWSPDNCFLAFVQGDQGQELIWVASTDGQGMQALRVGLLPNWSPDGSRITYAQRAPFDSLIWREVQIKTGQPARGQSGLDGGRPTRTFYEVGLGVAPHSLDQLLDGATLVVTATVGPVVRYVETFGPDRASEPRPLEAFDSPLAGFPATDFLLEVEQVVVDDGSIARGEPIILRELGAITEHLKNLSRGGAHEPPWTGDRYLFVLVPYWDGKEKVYSASYGPYGQLIVDSNLVRVNGGERQPIQFVDSEEPIPFDEFIQFVQSKQ